MTISSCKGQALVEVALSLVLLLLIVFGITEFGRVMYMTNTLNNAARVGARLAMVSKPLNRSTIESAVITTIPFDTTSLAIALEGNDTAGSEIKVTLTLPYKTVLPASEVFSSITKLNDITLKGEATMRHE